MATEFISSLALAFSTVATEFGSCLAPAFFKPNPNYLNYDKVLVFFDPNTNLDDVKLCDIFGLADNSQFLEIIEHMLSNDSNVKFDMQNSLHQIILMVYMFMMTKKLSERPDAYKDVIVKLCYCIDHITYLLVYERSAIIADNYNVDYIRSNSCFVWSCYIKKCFVVFQELELTSKMDKFEQSGNMWCTLNSKLDKLFWTKTDLFCIETAKYCPTNGSVNPVSFLCEGMLEDESQCTTTSKNRNCLDGLKNAASSITDIYALIKKINDELPNDRREVYHEELISRLLSYAFVISGFAVLEDIMFKRPNKNAILNNLHSKVMDYYDSCLKMLAMIFRECNLTMESDIKSFDAYQTILLKMTESNLLGLYNDPKYNFFTKTTFDSAFDSKIVGSKLISVCLIIC